MNTGHLRMKGEAPGGARCAVACWADDAGKMGRRIADQLIGKLDAREAGEIELVDFFPLGGVSVEDDVAEFPESKFYYAADMGVVVFTSDAPASNWYEFLNAVLDALTGQFRARELYTMGGMVSMTAHTTPRQLLAVAASDEAKEMLEQYGITRDIDYETPDGQRPTLNSFLLWLAKARGLAAAGLWVPVPFYMVGSEDPSAWKKALEFLNSRFELDIDLSDLDAQARTQNERIEQFLANAPDLRESVQRLESNLMISQEDSEKLVTAMNSLLSQRG